MFYFRRNSKNCFVKSQSELKKENPNVYRVAVETTESDQIMNDTFFLGTYPGLTKEMLDFEIQTINSYISTFKKLKS